MSEDKPDPWMPWRLATPEDFEQARLHGLLRDAFKGVEKCPCCGGSGYVTAENRTSACHKCNTDSNTEKVK